MAQTLPETMQAAAFDRFGGPEVLGIKTVPVPQCGDDEIIIRAEAAGVGTWDALERQGEMVELLEGPPRFPYVQGTDGAGEVVAVGSAVRGFKPGDRVYGVAFMSAKGSFYAQYVAVKEHQAAPIPRGLKVEQAAALAADGCTALIGLEDKLQLKQGQRLVIFGASGGVGHIAVQLARRMGAKVLAVASGDDGVELARRCGADAVVEGRKGDVAAACRAFAPDGPDAALVLANGDAAQAVLQHLRKGGRIAYPNGVEPAPRAPEGVELLAYDGIPGPKTLPRLNALVEQEPFHLEVSRLYPLKEAAKAQEEVLKHHLGKFALRIN
ncbi:NADP-dependent oxidoreductase [Corallococcus sp. BB11-1]|uniref:NADP-dependent oxidoreductase n=1 Tax=Corallococcus sp. BB11-1 TaxID=2996783 RepID=UPI0022708E41|nr:NADP-dependent oxidoreductase [Corallococcus sp. BB11-1]MCY1031462.1 NADP-dependent oxidoreductase [Corallococcus sp. BB11-1]